MLAAMTNQAKTLAIAAFFLLGCAVAGVSFRWAIPPANAQQTVTPTRWEYHCFRGTQNITKRSNQLGARGWEMVAASRSAGLPQRADMVWCFKRPKTGRGSR